jgi:hypothetical protein
MRCQATKVARNKSVWKAAHAQETHQRTIRPLREKSGSSVFHTSWGLWQPALGMTFRCACGLTLSGIHCFAAVYRLFRAILEVGSNSTSGVTPKCQPVFIRVSHFSIETKTKKIDLLWRLTQIPHAPQLPVPEDNRRGRRDFGARWSEAAND